MDPPLEVKVKNKSPLPMLMNAAQELSLQNRFYKKAVEQYVWQAYLADIKRGDVTTKYFLARPNRKVTAQITVNEPGILAGLEEAFWLLKKAGIQITQARSEGRPVMTGSKIMSLSGRADKILGVERSLINLLQRMSGIATYTSKLKKKLPRNIHLLATRKTLWGLLDKRAVVVGGGKTHRLDLSDAILIKDNHLQLSPNWEKGFKKALKKSAKVRFVEIELESLEDVETFCQLYEIIPKKYKQNVVVMLDNFKPSQVKELAPKLSNLGVFVEVSGGISGKNIHHYLLPGVSAVSCGSLTSRSHALDMSLHFDS